MRALKTVSITSSETHDEDDSRPSPKSLSATSKTRIAKPKVPLFRWFWATSYVNQSLKKIRKIQ
jgi:hypothetical protein